MPMTWSTRKKNIAASAAMANTSPVVTIVSLRDGQVTLVTSARTSRTNFAGSTATSLFSSPGREGLCALAAPLAGVEGLEPPASGFGDRRSSQLSYTPGSTPTRPRPVAPAPLISQAAPKKWPPERRLM